MEDDVLFLRNLSAGKLQSVSKALDTLPPDWMIFYLGHWPLWAYFVGPEVLRTGSVCAHAYIASPGLLTWLKDHPYESPDVKKAPRIVGNGIDAAYARLAQTYAFFPMIAIQSRSKSDNIPIEPAKKKRKLRHLIRRSKYREVLLSSLMRPAEFFTAALSPVFYAFRHALDRYNRWH
jgi:hypothetical protein